MKLRLITFCILSLIGAAMKVSAQLNPLTVGKLAPGDSIVIYYDVTINSPCGCTQITNQGTVSGSNFSTVMTDDPETAAAGDPTITLLNLFPLPVNIMEFRARARNGEVELSWTASEDNVERYMVERLAGGSVYNTIQTVAAHGNGTHTYQATDASPLNGDNFYRLKTIDRDGKIAYSGIVKVNLGDKGSFVEFYPNPVQDGSFTMRLSNMPVDDYVLEVYNATGQVVYREALKHAGGSVIVRLQLPGGYKGLMAVKLKGKKTVHGSRVLFL